jgi:hypothetical protein
VVAGGAHGAEGVADAPVDDGVEGLEDAAGGAEGDFEGVFGELGIAGGKLAGAEEDILPDDTEVGGGMDERDLRLDGIPGLDGEELFEEPSAGETLFDGADAKGDLGVAAGLVEGEEGVADQAGARPRIDRGDIGEG